MWMALAKELRRRVVGLRLDDRIAANVILRVRDSLGIDAPGLAEGGSNLNDRLLVSVHPFHPGVHALLLCSRVEFFIAFSKSAMEAV